MEHELSKVLVFSLLLASVIETCRIRQQCPWRYLESVIDNRRAGFLAPPLPAIIC